MIDLAIRGGTVVRSSGLTSADVGIDGGVIVEVSPRAAGAREEIDARGLLVMPGLIDVHLHFNDPGRTSWEGAATGSRALAAGGGTVFFDMPLNSTPCTVNAAAFDLKHMALLVESIADFGLWGGLVPGSVPDMAAVAARGAIGFKAFMCDSGLPEFPRADERTLADGMREAARLGLPVAVHAESEEMTRGLIASAAGRTACDFLRTRPVAAELEAIKRALSLARETGVALHIVHVSSGRGVALAAAARAEGVNVSIETCPHYLFFTAEDLDRLGTIGKCAPPLRNREDQDALWAELLNGTVDIVASDHSPTEPALKDKDFMSAWGGIAGVQSTLAVLVDRGHHERGLGLERIAALLAETPARRFRIKGKGAIAVGNDADVVLLDPGASFTLDAGDLHQRHRMSPYVGASFRGMVRQTIRRGETIFANGQITARARGRLVRPGIGD